VASRPNRKSSDRRAGRSSGSRQPFSDLSQKFKKLHFWDLSNLIMHFGDSSKWRKISYMRNGAFLVGRFPLVLLDQQNPIEGIWADMGAPKAVTCIAYIIPGGHPATPQKLKLSKYFCGGLTAPRKSILTVRS
jgi:hypothetical protein